MNTAPLQGWQPTLEELRLGALGSAISLPVGWGGMKATQSLVQSLGLSFERSPAFFQFFEILSKVTNKLLKSALKCIAVVYIAFFVPVIEEWFFRDLLYRRQELMTKAPDSLAARTYRVLANGLVFGAFHLSLFQGWVNLLIFVATTIAGLTFAILREMTGSTRASIVAHSLNNSCFMLIKLLKP